MSETSNIKDKLSLERLEELILDENKAYHEYKALGFIKLAREEREHEKILRRLKKAYYK